MNIEQTVSTTTNDLQMRLKMIRTSIKALRGSVYYDHRLDPHLESMDADISKSLTRLQAISEQVEQLIEANECLTVNELQTA